MMLDRDLLIKTYTAFNARDIDAVLALMHPDVDWPNGMEGGRVAGHQGVRQYWTRQWGMIDPHVYPVGFRPAADGRTVVEVRQIICDLAGTLILDCTVEHIYLIEDGLIKSMQIRTP